MPVIKTIAELLDEAGAVVTAPDPLAELHARGFRLAHDVQARLDAAGPATRLEPTDRRRQAALADRLGRVRSTVTSAARPVSDALPVGEYDVVVALRLAIINETLAALSQGMRYPRELTDANGIGLIFTMARLDALSDDVPAGVRIGPLRLTAPCAYPPSQAPRTCCSSRNFLSNCAGLCHSVPVRPGK